MTDTLQDNIRAVIAEIIEVDAEKILADTRLREDLGADSMSALEIMSTLEEKYGVVLKPDHLPEMATLGRIVLLVTNLRGAA